MPAIRCQQCRQIAPENQGFCPDCGAMFVEPFEFVDNSELAASKKKPAWQAPKKKGGFLSSLFAAKAAGSGAEDSSTSLAEEEATPAEDILMQTIDLSFEGLRIRCQECRNTVPANEHEGFCPECGAFFVTPYDYLTEDDASSLKPKVQMPAKVDKPFEEMTPSEQLAALQEQIHDLYDQINNQRHHVNEKANECMQCFTAAGTIKSQNTDEVLGSMIKRRYENLANFEVLYTEYKRMLEELKDAFNHLVEAKQGVAQRQQQPTAEVTATPNP